MAALSLPEVLAQLRVLLAEIAPGHNPKRLTVEMDNGEKFKLPFGVGVPTLPPPTNRPLPPARHSVDFRSVHWFGVDYELSSAIQAAVVKVLWEAWENGTPDVGQDAILEAAGSDGSRMRDLFRNHPAWGTLIVSTGTPHARTFRLNEP